VELRGQRLSFAVESRKICEFLAILTVHGAAEPGPAVSFDRGVVSVSTAGWQDSFAASGKAGALESDGDHLMIRRQGKSVVRWAANNARRLSFDGRAILTASAPVTVVAGARTAVVEAKTAVEISILTPAGRIIRSRVGAGRHELHYS